jgi:membrane-associated HD superfamily phosphohydrolase
LSSKSKKRKIPFAIIFISGLNVSVGIAGLIVMFFVKETKSFVYDFLLKAGVFLFAAVNIFLGIILVKLKPYAKVLILWILAIFAIFDIVFTLTTEHSKYIFGFIGFYAVVFTMYYSGLNEKYFKSGDEGFSLRSDAAIKKERSTITDFFKE